jgi:endonuclease V-like protein UPF0215 family
MNERQAPGVAVGNGERVSGDANRARQKQPVTSGKRGQPFVTGFLRVAAVGPHNNNSTIKGSKLMKRMKTISLGLILLAGLLFAGARAADLSDCCPGSACCVVGAECCEK